MSDGLSPILQLITVPTNAVNDIVKLILGFNPLRLFVRNMP